jgi:tetratricopeptide (TPR) repeat protein
VCERAAIVALALLAFGASLWSPFFFDDYALATDPAVTKPGGLWELAALARTRPLTYATFWANYQTAGFAPLSYHLTNLALFALTVWLAGDVFQGLTTRPAAWIALAIFALHPLQTEAVAYVFARATLLTTLFCLLSWRAWLDGFRWRAVGWFAAALLAKEEGAAFPVFLAGFEWFHQKRREGWREICGPLGAMLGLVVVFAARLLYATRVTAGSGAGFELGEITPWTYLLTQGRVVWLYLRLFVAPAGQTFDRDFRLSTSADLGSLAAWAALVALLCGALALSRRWRAAWWFAGALILLAPTSSIAPLADLTAERRMFLPLASLSLGAGAVIANLAGRRARAVGVALALALCIASWRRTQTFSSEVALWRDAEAKAPTKVRPKLQLARALGADGPASTAERKKLLDEARALSDDADVLGEIGVFYLQSSQPETAAQAFHEAIERDPGDAQLRTNLGTSLVSLGRMEEAERNFRGALAIDPCNFDARNNLMFVLRRKGAVDEARILASAPRHCPFSQEQLEALDAARGLH